MKRISDCMHSEYVVESPSLGKQQILTSDISNRKSLDESLIVENDQMYTDYDFVAGILREEKRSEKNQNLETSHIITSTAETWLSLSEYQMKYGDYPFPAWMTAMILCDVSKALLQLHSRQVSHGAIVAQNIYFLKNIPKVCLFVNQTHARKISPEHLLEARPDDLCQLGSILWKCLTGKQPVFLASGGGDVANPTGPFSTSEFGLELARKMMARKFSESISYISNHPFVQNAMNEKTPRFLKFF